MERSQIKSILLADEREYTGEKTVITKRLKSLIRRLTNVNARFSGKETEDENLIWFCDNFYFILNVLSGLAAVRRAVFSDVLRECSKLAEVCEKPFDAEAIAALFEVLKQKGADDRMFRSVGDTLLFSLCVSVERSLSESTGGVGDLIISLRFVGEFDFSALISDFSDLERLLRSDPGALYSRSDRATQAMIKNRVTRLAQKNKMSAEDFLSRLIARAEKENKTLFELLERPPRGALFFLFRTILFVLFALGFGALTARAGMGFVWFLCSVLLLPCAWRCAGEISGFAASAFAETSVLPRLRLDRCPDDALTCVALTCMVGDAAEAYALCEKLEDLFLSQFPAKKKDANVYFGIIGDLSPSDVEKTPEDEAVRYQLTLSLEHLNLKYGGGFFAYLRGRVYNEGENAFIGEERKRGAIRDFAEDCGKKIHADRFIGDHAALEKAKLLVTLDRDTTIGFRQLYRLIGAMLHPHNRPVVESVRGVPVVKKGYGVLQPRILSRTGKKTTPLAVMLCGAGGAEPYASAAFDVYQDVFGCGMFCGKGVIDLEAYRRVCSDAFENNLILSHDIPEGARLRCGFLSDQCFFECVPDSTLSLDSRKHRWIRGDVQSLGCAANHVRDSSGERVRNPVEAIYRFVLADNVISDLSCVFVFLLICACAVLPGAFAWRLAFAATLHLFAPVVLCCLGLVVSGKLKNASFSFYSKVLSGVWVCFLSFLKNLCSLASDAVTAADAFFRSLWRMNVSKKHLLEWKTFSSFSGSGSIKSHLISNLFSLAAGLALIVFSPNRPSRLFGLLWTFYPFVSYLISKPYRAKRGLSEKNRGILLGYLRDLYGFFSEHSGARNAYLVPDNISVSPLESESRLCSPTNAGLYLLSLAAARDLGFIDTPQMTAKLKNALSTLEKLEKHNGHLLNWYDLSDLSPAGKKYVSTVDSGNFCVCLVCLVNALKGYRREDARIDALIAGFDRLVENTRFDFLFDRGKNLFYVGCDVESGRKDPHHYDLYMSEARTTSFLCVSRGLVPSGHWNALGRPLVKNKNHVGAASWTGTAFEYFMSALFLPVLPDSFESEALDFAYHAQKSFCWGNQRVFGVSESGFFEFDNELNYQYKAMGVPALRLKRENEDTLVISPYSSFLMLREAPDTVMKNLASLRRLGMYGKYGFYEALDCSHSRTGGCAVVKSYMAHHLGMSLIAGANMLLDDIFVKRFCADENVRASLILLEEKIPVDAPIPKKAVSVRERESLPKKRPLREKTHVREERFFVYGGSGMSLVASSRGACQLAVRSKDESILFSRPYGVNEKGGLIVRVKIAGTTLSSLKCENPEGAVWSFYDCAGCCQTVVRYKKTLVRFTFVPIMKENAALGVSIDVKGAAAGEASAVIECFPILCEKKRYEAHPAFCDLFCEYSSSDTKTLVIARRGGARESRSLCAALGFSGNEEAFACCGEGQDMLFSKPLSRFAASDEKFPLLYPHAGIQQKKSVGYSDRTVSFAFAIAVDADEKAAAGACRRVAAELSKRRSLSDALARGASLARRFRAPAVSDFEDRVLKKWLFGDCARFASGTLNASLNDLWAFSVSGDVPVVTALFEQGDEERLRQIVVRKKFHHLCGISYDLVFPVGEDGYRHERLDAFSRIIFEERAGHLLGKKGGIHPVSGDKETVGFFSLASDVFFSSCVHSVRTAKLRIAPSGFSEKTSGRFENGGFLTESKSELFPKWSHVLSSACAGTVVCDRSLGFTWFSNSSQKKLSCWNGDRFSARREETLLFSADGVNHTDLVARSEKVFYRAGGAVYSGNAGNVGYEIAVCIHPRLHFKLIRCRLELKAEGEYYLGFRFTPALGENSFVHGNIFVKTDGDLLVFRKIPHENNFSLPGFVLSSGEASEAEEAELLNDSSVCFKRKLHASSPGNVNVYFALGAAGSEKYIDAVRRALNEESFLQAADFCRKVLPAGTDGNGIYPFWLSYQAVFSRFFARSGFYQCGGAFGFRDQLQDCLVFLPERPRFAKLHLLRCACHQFPEGDVLHWWHNVGPGAHQGIRTRISDDYLWFPLILSLYVRKTADASILSLEAPYLSGAPLGARERERYEAFAFTRERETLAEHARRAIELFFNRGVGAHGLPLMGAGDWNDGMDLVGKNGGESVWLGMFALTAVKIFDETVGLTGGLKKRFDEAFAIIERAIEASFNGKWFARAYFSDKTPLGDDTTFGSECSIDLLPQAFYVLFQHVFYKGKNAEALDRARTACRNAAERLFDKENKVLRLFAPSFSSHSPDPGYISSYGAGLRENGGQYTHASVWFCFALYYLSRTEEGGYFGEILEKVLDAVDPQRFFENDFRMCVFRNEPYVLSGDVYHAPGKIGRGGWSWYTGAAGWLYSFYKLRGSQKKTGAPAAEKGTGGEKTASGAGPEADAAKMK